MLTTSLTAMRTQSRWLAQLRCYCSLASQEQRARVGVMAPNRVNLGVNKPYKNNFMSPPKTITFPSENTQHAHGQARRHWKHRCGKNKPPGPGTLAGKVTPRCFANLASYSVCLWPILGRISCNNWCRFHRKDSAPLLQLRRVYHSPNLGQSFLPVIPDLP